MEASPLDERVALVQKLVTLDAERKAVQQEADSLAKKASHLDAEYWKLHQKAGVILGYLEDAPMVAPRPKW